MIARPVDTPTAPAPTARANVRPRRWLRSTLIALGLLALGAAGGGYLVFLRITGAAAPLEQALPAVAIPAGIDHAPWSVLLARYTDARGRVDYAALRTNHTDRQALDTYVAALAQGTPTTNPIEALATGINAYNAFVWTLVLEHPEIASIKDLDAPFATPHFTLAGLRLSLDALETGLRATHDFRLHAALVCAARSCPPLRSEAYAIQPARLDAQLDTQMRRWLADPALNRFDPQTRTAALSGLFTYYREDLRGPWGSLEALLAVYGPADWRSALSQGIARREFLAYDWALNAQP